MEAMQYKGPEDPNADREELLAARAERIEKRLADEGRMIPTGHLQEVTGQRLERANKESIEGEEYARKSETHLWIVVVSHKATDQLLDHRDGKRGAMPILDADTIWMEPTVGCYICEQTYEPRLRLRKCPGEPS